MVNPYASYKKTSVNTMTPVEIVIKIYSEIERQLALGIQAIEEKDYKKKNDALIKAQELIGGLRGALDMSIPLSKNLEALYVYFQNETMIANVRKDVKRLKALIPMVKELRDAYTQVSQMTKEQIAAQSKGKK